MFFKKGNASQIDCLFGFFYLFINVSFKKKNESQSNRHCIKKIVITSAQV